MNRNNFYKAVPGGFRLPELVAAAGFVPLNHRRASLCAFTCDVKDQSVQQTLNQVALSKGRKNPRLVKSSGLPILDQPCIRLE